MSVPARATTARGAAAARGDIIGRISKVTRYWPGKPPPAAEGADDCTSDDDDIGFVWTARGPSAAASPDEEERVVGRQGHDRRLRRRLADVEELTADRRRGRQAKFVSTVAPAEEITGSRTTTTMPGRNGGGG
ncbi:hypothetical protein ACP4OV_012736 [Aristida adscensionis]